MLYNILSKHIANALCVDVLTCSLNKSLCVKMFVRGAVRN